MFFDFSQDITVPLSVTIRESIVDMIDIIVEKQRQLQPQYKNKINRSSVMTILLAKSLEDNRYQCESITLAMAAYLESLKDES